jgi:hypothetical protein
MRLFILSVACLAVPYFCTLSYVRYDNRERKLYLKYLSFYENSSRYDQKWKHILNTRCVYYFEGGREWFRVPAKKKSGPRSRVPPKNRYTISEGLTLSENDCGWSERVNCTVGKQQYYLERQKYMQHCPATDPVPEGRAPVICTGSPFPLVDTDSFI